VRVRSIAAPIAWPKRRVLAQAHELEAKRRRSGLVKDETELAEFFSGKLPVK